MPEDDIACEFLDGKFQVKFVADLSQRLMANEEVLQLRMAVLDVITVKVKESLSSQKKVRKSCCSRAGLVRLKSGRYEVLGEVKWR